MVGGGGGGGKWRVLKLLKSSVIATFSTISEVGAGSPSLVASQLTNGVIGLCAGSLSEFPSLGLRRFFYLIFLCSHGLCALIVSLYTTCCSPYIVLWAGNWCLEQKGNAWIWYFMTTKNRLLQLCWYIQCGLAFIHTDVLIECRYSTSNAG